jgi:hypothetical protein
MTKLSGYIFASAGLAGFFFFINYHGTQIPLKELWFVVTIFLGIYGAFLIVKHKYQSQENNEIATAEALRIDRIKQTGDKIKVTLESCEVKSRSYQEENINTYFATRIEMVDGLYDSNRNYKIREIQQTYIVYYKKYRNITYKFVSQAVSQSADTLKSYIDKQGVVLYVDRTNPKNYYFDLSGE